MWLEGKDDIYEKAYLVHCADQLFIMWISCKWNPAQLVA